MPVIAKVEFHQQWVRRETIYEMDANGNKTPVDPVAGKHLPPVFVSDEGVSQYAAVPNFNKEAVVVLSALSRLVRPAGVPPALSGGSPCACPV